MIYLKSFITLLSSECQDTPIYKILLKALINKDMCKNLYLAQDRHSFKNTGLECCSGQYIDIKVTLNDIYMYMSENELLRFNHIKSDYFNSDDFMPNPPFTEFEYWAKYNKITASQKNFDILKEKKELNTKAILFGIEDKGDYIPSFIKDYLNIKKHSLFKFDIEEKGVYTYLKQESPVYKDTSYSNNIFYKFCNIPYEYYSKHIIQPCSLHYNYTLKKFISSMKEEDQIKDIIIDINKNGLRNPLFLKINKYGTITQPINCNTRLISALYLKLPYIPTVLIYDGTTDITTYINDYNNSCYDIFNTLFPDFSKELDYVK